MKTSGICNAQSARKHRKQGHIVTKTFGNRYMWLACSAPGAVVRNNGGGNARLVADIMAVPSVVRNGTFGKMARPIGGIVVREGSSLTPEMHNAALANMDKPNLNAQFGKMGRPLDLVDAKGDAVGVRPLVPGAVAICPLTQIIIQQGGVYRPKRGNQHSKTFNVVEIEDSRIYYTRGDGKVVIGEDVVDLAPRIGRRVDVES